MKILFFPAIVSNSTYLQRRETFCFSASHHVRTCKNANSLAFDVGAGHLTALMASTTEFDRRRPSPFGGGQPVYWLGLRMGIGEHGLTHVSFQCHEEGKLKHRLKPHFRPYP